VIPGATAPRARFHAHPLVMMSGHTILVYPRLTNPGGSPLLGWVSRVRHPQVNGLEARRVQPGRYHGVAGLMESVD
jgi:hypothetical protein